jgi:hypothetical protein
MAKVSTVNVFETVGQNGARVLIECINPISEGLLQDGFVVIDCQMEIADINGEVNKEITSYFLINRRNGKFYELELKECYELLALYVCSEADEVELLNKASQLINEAEKHLTNHQMYLL